MSIQDTSNEALAILQVAHNRLNPDWFLTRRTQAGNKLLHAIGRMVTDVGFTRQIINEQAENSAITIRSRGRAVTLRVMSGALAYAKGDGTNSAPWIPIDLVFDPRDNHFHTYLDEDVIGNSANASRFESRGRDENVLAHIVAILMLGLHEQTASAED